MHPRCRMRSRCCAIPRMSACSRAPGPWYAPRGFALEAQATWEKPRQFEEWMGIVNDPERVAPLRVIVAALAHAGVRAGIGLSLSGGDVVFFHRWLMVRARKPAR